jgi:Plasmid pRiA4b ORF-3-like protein
MRAPIPIYRLRIALPYLDPPIWRRLEISSAIPFSMLHNAIQAVMGWDNCHLWAFYVGKTEISPREEMDYAQRGSPRGRPADSTALDEMLAGEGATFQFVYDMGDSWEHEITVEAVLTPETDVQYPRCTEGARACPPEDCGGFPGYMNILEAISDPKHPEREELLDWIGEDFDPEAFDIDAVNGRLQPRKRRPQKAAKK